MIRDIVLSVSNALIFLSVATVPTAASAQERVDTLAYYDGHSGLLIRTNKTVESIGCVRKDYYLLPKAHPHYQEMVSLVFTLAASSKPIFVQTSGCLENFPKVYSIQAVF